MVRHSFSAIDREVGGKEPITRLKLIIRFVVDSVHGNHIQLLYVEKSGVGLSVMFQVFDVSS